MSQERDRSPNRAASNTAHRIPSQLRSDIGQNALWTLQLQKGADPLDVAGLDTCVPSVEQLMTLRQPRTSRRSHNREHRLGDGCDLLWAELPSFELDEVTAEEDRSIVYRL
jgi:hypothetical protein